jgi:hypothetical protein
VGEEPGKGYGGVDLMKPLPKVSIKFEGVDRGRGSNEALTY